MTCWHERTADWSEGGRREESKRIIYMKHFLFHWCSVPGKGIDSANGHGICRIFSMGGSFAEVPQILLCAFNLLSGAITNNLKLYYISPIHACDFLGSGRMPVFTVIPPPRSSTPIQPTLFLYATCRLAQSRNDFNGNARPAVTSLLSHLFSLSHTRSTAAVPIHRVQLRKRLFIPTLT